MYCRTGHGNQRVTATPHRLNMRVHGESKIVAWFPMTIQRQFSTLRLDRGRKLSRLLYWGRTGHDERCPLWRFVLHAATAAVCSRRSSNVRVVMLSSRTRLVTGGLNMQQQMMICQRVLRLSRGKYRAKRSRLLVCWVL